MSCRFSRDSSDVQAAHVASMLRSICLTPSTPPSLVDSSSALRSRWNSESALKLLVDPFLNGGRLLLALPGALSSLNVEEAAEVDSIEGGERLRDRLCVGSKSGEGKSARSEASVRGVTTMAQPRRHTKGQS